MAKTKGLRKTKHGKRHSRKKYGGEETLTKQEAENRKEEINDAIKNIEEEKTPLNEDKLAYLNRYIDIQNIGLFTTGEKGKTKQKEILDEDYKKIKRNSDLGKFIAIVKSGILKKNDLNESKEKIESTIRENADQLEKFKKEKIELEKKFKIDDWPCPKSLEMSYTINGSKPMGEYKGAMERTTGQYGYKGKCVPNGEGTWKSNNGENTIEGIWDMGNFVDEKEGGKKKRSKKTQRKRKRKHRVSKMQIV